MIQDNQERFIIYQYKAEKLIHFAKTESPSNENAFI